MENICESYSFLSVIVLIKYLMQLIQIALPILLIFFIVFDLIKALITNDSNLMTKTISVIGKRIFYAVLLFVVPTIISLVISILDNTTNSNNTFLSCYNNASMEKVESLKIQEQNLKEIENKKIEESLKEALKEIEKPVREEVSSPEIISIPEVKTYKTIDEKDEEKLEQEEMDAIISINELETKGQKLYDSLEQEKIDEEEIPISIEELYETMELPTLNMKKLERIEEAKEEKKKEEKALYDLTETKEYPLVELEKDEVISKEQEKNKEILDEELKKTDEFLNFLKELKKNIE